MEKKNILIFGDSNTWGWNPSNTLLPPYERWSDEERYAGVLQQKLGEEYRVIPEGLNGRTTVLEDPVEEWRCGKLHLIPLLDSHAPLDLVIILLGTNDLKKRFSVGPFDIAEGAGVLVGKTLAQKNAFRNAEPKVILVCPPRLGKVEETIFKDMFGGGEEISKQLPEYFEKVANLHGVSYINADDIVKTSAIDGVHWDKGEHRKFGKKLAKKVKEII